MKISNITEASIDFSTICQLRCVECSTSKGITHKGIVGKGQLHLSDFCLFVDNNPQIRRIEMSNWGEIFLNPDMEEIFKYAFEHNVTLYCGNGTNFNNVEDNVLEALVKYKVEFLNLSIDGATQETYEQYRVGGNFKKVIHNIERLNFYKNAYSSAYPKLSWQFIIFGHNEHEIPQVKELCRKYNMVFNPKLNYSNFSPVRNKDYVRKESGLGVADRKEYKELFKKEYKAPCYHCFTSPQINWNGDILGCSVNKWSIMGNAFKTSINDWEKSDYYKNLVEVLFYGKECTSVLPCYFCPNYEKIKDNHLSSKGLQEYIDYVPPALKDKNNDNTRK
jgi:MoaA/NifB/PqqE/SkfB family radical SAM enzyme